MDKNTKPKKAREIKRKVVNREYMITDMELGDDMNEIIYMYEEKPLPYKSSDIDTRRSKDEKD